MRKTLDFGHFSPFWLKFWTDAAQNDQFSSFPEKSKNVTFLHSLRLAFMHKIREIQYAVFEKMRKTLDFGHFWPFWLKFWTDAAQNDQFSSFPEKSKNVTFLHSLRLEFMQKIREIQYAVFLKMRKTFDFGHFWPFCLKFWKDAAQNDQFLSYPEKNKNVTFLHSLRLAFMQKIREIQYAVFEQMRNTLEFGHFWPFWPIFGQTRPKMTNFRVFLKKTKNVTFYTP